MVRLLWALIMTVSLVHPSQGQTLPPNISDQLVLGGWSDAVGATWAANGRMYVWEKRGIVWVVENGVRLPAPLIDISEEVGNWRDHGLLGFTLDPNFGTNGRFYLMYAVDRHHLMHHGTATYDPASNHYLAASIVRITRYTAGSPNFTTAIPASRLVLFGETPSTGAPILHESHSAGTLVFGRDGTLIASVGDGASFATADFGSATESYWAEAIADGIIRPEENVGTFRSQMVNSFNGKILRLDPSTGDGIPSNPWYDAAAPRSPRSRVWALGLRNPYRLTLKPNTGSTDPAMGQPGILLFGDVGWNLWEELNVCTEGGQNFGWPLFEGMEPVSWYMNVPTANQDAPNPLYDGITCTQQFFTFQDLIKQATPVHLNAHPNPCSSTAQIPNSIPKHFHARPTIDWRHGNQSRCGSYDGNTAVTFDLDDPLSPVSGPRFGGFAAIGGPWMTASNFPAQYQNSSFHADYAMGWIKRFVHDENGNAVSVHDFASGLGNITWLGEGPDGCIHYIRYNSSEIRKICYTLNVDLPPIAVAQQNVQFGPSPLSVQFTGSTSTDPENGQLTYFWNFGNGQTSVQANPAMVFTATAGIPTTYNVSLTVTDGAGQQNSATLIVSVNNTPPVVQITSFEDGDFYPVGIDTLFQLQASVVDAEHGPGALSYAWRTVLHHNTHTHPEPVDDLPQTSTVISGVGCDGESYSYNIILTVTDAGGLATTVDHWLFPACHRIAPTAIISASSTAGMAPLSISFNALESYDPGEIVAYHWDFGDGTFSNSADPGKIFTATGDHLVTLTVTDDDGLTGQATSTISVITLDLPQCVGALGSIRREVWNDVWGTNISDLTIQPHYPLYPTATSFPASFVGPTNAGDNYGARFRGYIIAPQTGNYVFTITSDQTSEVYLSLNAETRHKRLICTVPGFTGATEYFKYPSQISTTIHLQAGAYYYVEVLHKEGTGPDHLALRWQTPGSSTRTIIPGSALARWQNCLPSVRVRLNLQGPHNPALGLMRDDLRAAGLVPLNEPYTALDVVHAGGGGGELTTPARLAITGKNAVVDWIIIELRDKNNPSIIIATRCALLERDGDIMGTDGYARLLFNVPADEYFIAVRHRNHLGTMTATPVALGIEQQMVDFTRANTTTFGNEAQRILPNGSNALWAGDADRNGQIRYTGSNNDRDRILLQIGGVVPTLSTSGYHGSDLNMDGVTRYTGSNNDRDLILQNIGGIIPTAVKNEQIP